MSIIGWAVLSVLILAVCVCLFAGIDHFIEPEREITCRVCNDTITTSTAYTIVWPDGTTTHRFCHTCANTLNYTH